ncbi:pyridoxal phosphate-dependent aminotransferase [Peptostreptococcus porci]|uniref:Aminotransferase n=1 Tax=Peptostreptococcus porci TaxID=2652282 RepID=A0A6N7WYM6_9FIRM|nr:pyridoxal phosphate-dependent aminotransferase [Peptostreptococcus porci]MDD7183133.1 pyridoxal phosphate-dependent aminotransferase [Peptostreptococcus porci]MDY2793900.1 pyridoxal phosphate-dependent aminotransferase [Peptostreptococcus porci]MDY4129609.1 pyridoxal phosphate-dependent aminotransferase [Peptostreptococcus porci]MDY5436815.1 pyridoxal phosphate-dependent aminotransferase [Peptostreptococcus porci]MDY5479544.1 pyridoxal phosphate-dependent aminotransferase [Peptostreptococcu
MKFSNRVGSMQASPVRKLVPFATAAKKDGVKVYHLNIGQPDIKTPEGFMKAVRDFDESVLEYADSVGSDELVNAMIEYYKGYDINYESGEILITNGGSEALLFAMMTLCNPGENILVPEPFYTNYNGFATSVDVQIRPITTKAEEGFHLPSKEKVLASLDENTRAILISNPGNPTGAIYTIEEMQMLAEVAIEKDLWIISDEVYREFVYDGLKYTSFGNLENVADRVIIVDSVSKRYSACGARIGSLASKNKEFIAQVLKLCQGRLCVPTLEMIGAAELYKTPKSYLEEVNKEYCKRRDTLYEEIMKIPGVVCEKPTGAFYMVVKLPVENAEDFVIFMLKEFRHNGATTMATPAENFYATPGLGRDEVRLAYILNCDDLKASAECLRLGLEAYKAAGNK